MGMNQELKVLYNLKRRIRGRGSWEDVTNDPLSLKEH